MAWPQLGRLVVCTFYPVVEKNCFYSVSLNLVTVPRRNTSSQRSPAILKIPFINSNLNFCHPVTTICGPELMTAGFHAMCQKILFVTFPRHFVSLQINWRTAADRECWDRRLAGLPPATAAEVIARAEIITAVTIGLSLTGHTRYQPGKHAAYEKFLHIPRPARQPRRSGHHRRGRADEGYRAVYVSIACGQERETWISPPRPASMTLVQYHWFRIRQIFHF